MKLYIVVIKILLINKKDNNKNPPKIPPKNLIKMVRSKMTCPRWHLGQVR